MAVAERAEIELVGGGVDARRPEKGAFVYNMLRRDGAWSVRKGFGVVSYFDTALTASRAEFSPASTTGTADERGLLEHLGSKLFRTSFGHEQVISVFYAKAIAGNQNSVSASSMFLPLYIVRIYDLTTDTVHEEPVYRHTAEQSTSSAVLGMEMVRWRPHYHTNRDYDNQAWVLARNPQLVFFVEVDDRIFFGNAEMGLLVYEASTFRSQHATRKNPLQIVLSSPQIDSLHTVEDAHPFGESCLVTRAVATPGALGDLSEYARASEFPKPSGGLYFQGRLVLFEGRQVSFSDVDFPLSIAAANFFSLPTDQDITGIAEVDGTLLVFTANETWLYQPPQSSFIVTAGRLTRLATGIGCVGQNGIAYTESGRPLWVGPRGCYISKGVGSIETISGDIDNFFTSTLESPLHSHPLANGEIASASDDQLHTSYRFDPSKAHVSCCAGESICLFTFPDQLLSLVYNLENGQWSVWSYETMVNRQTAQPPAASRSIVDPWVMSDNDYIYMLSGPRTETLVNQARILGVRGASRDTVNRYFALLRYGRGGGVDHSGEAGEDRREAFGVWQEAALLGGVASQDEILIGKPIPVQEDMYVYQREVPAGTVLLPVSFRRDSAATNIHEFSLFFAFDNTRWKPLFVTASGSNAAIAWAPAPEHGAALDGGMTHSQANYAAGAGYGCVCTDAAFNLDASGAYVHVKWVGAVAAPGTWAHQPDLNTRHFGEDMILYLPFRPLTADYMCGLGILPLRDSAFTYILEAAHTYVPRTFVWESATLGSSAHTDNDLARPVDWAYKSASVDGGNGSQIRSRGVEVRMLTHGVATLAYRLVPDWGVGLLNVLFGADFREWSSQALEVDLDPTGELVLLPPALRSLLNKVTTQARSNNASGRNAFAEGIKYGTAGVAATSNAQGFVGSQEVNNLVVSDSLRGETLSHMLWGHIRNKAEAITLSNAVALIQKVGLRRRYGR